MKNFFPLQAWEDKKILMTSLPGRRKNLMKCNPAKCNYMILSRSKEKSSTRLKIGDSVLERKQTSKNSRHSNQ